MKFSILLSAVFCAVALAAPTPAPEPEWSYTKAFDYAISMGGPLEENIVAKVIKRHVEKNGLDWSSNYSDITTDEGAVLNLAPELRRRTAKPQISESAPQLAKKALEKRLPLDITGYIWTDNCSSTNFTWYNVGAGCIAYWVNGQRVRMYSLKIANKGKAYAEMRINVWRDKGGCSGYSDDNIGADSSYCYKTKNGRGFMSFAPYISS